MVPAANGAADSGYDHWKSRDYYGPEFHNVPLIDGKGPAQDTPGALSDILTKGPIQTATMTATYQGCTWRRTLHLMHGRYLIIVDNITADREHARNATDPMYLTPPGAS